MIIKVVYCLNCDPIHFNGDSPNGICKSCKKDTARIVEINVPDEGDKYVKERK